MHPRTSIAALFLLSAQLLSAQLLAGDAVAFYAPPAYADEMGGGVDVMVTRTGSGVGAISVDVTVSGGLSGAALGVDYQAAAPGTLTWANGDRSYKVVHVPILHNPAYAPWHNLALNLGNPQGGAVLDSDMAQIHIPLVEHEANPAGYLSVLLPDASQLLSLRDDIGGLQVMVARSGGSLGAVSTTVSFVTGLGAVVGTDFTLPANPTLSWADGESGVKSLLIPIIPRVQARGPLMFSFNIYSLTGNVGLGCSGANVTITDHLAASAGTATCSNLVSVSELAGTASIQVGRSGSAIGAVSLDYTISTGSALDGVNLTTGSGTLHWADGDSAAKTVTVPVLADHASAPTLYAYIGYSNPGGGLILPQNSGTSLAITNADGVAGMLIFATGQVTVSEAAGPAVVTVSRVGGSTGAISVDWTSTDGSAISGVHYAGGSGTLNWAVGDSADKTINFPLVHDGTLGPIHYFNVSMSNASGGAVIDNSDPDYGPMANVVITDADCQAGTIAWLSTTVQVHESAGSVVLTARRSGGSVGPVSVPVTAADLSARLGADYAIGNVAALVWADGDTADKSLTIPIIHDGTAGTDRDFRVLLGPPSGGATWSGPTPAIVTILEDDQVLPVAMASGGVALPAIGGTSTASSSSVAAPGGGGGCGAGGVALLMGMACAMLRLRRR